MSELEQKIQQLEGLLKQSVALLQLAVNKLGQAQGLEWSQDLQDWVSKDKLNELRSNPR